MSVTKAQISADFIIELADPWFSLIKTRQKIVYVTRNDSIQFGSKILFINNGLCTLRYCTVVVGAIAEYGNIHDLMDFEGIENVLPTLPVINKKQVSSMFFYPDSLYYAIRFSVID